MKKTINLFFNSGKTNIYNAPSRKHPNWINSEGSWNIEENFLLNRNEVYEIHFVVVPQAKIKLYRDCQLTGQQLFDILERGGKCEHLFEKEIQQAEVEVTTVDFSSGTHRKPTEKPSSLNYQQIRELTQILCQEQGIEWVNGEDFPPSQIQSDIENKVSQMDTSNNIAIKHLKNHKFLGW